MNVASLKSRMLLAACGALIMSTVLLTALTVTA